MPAIGTPWPPRSHRSSDEVRRERDKRLEILRLQLQFATTPSRRRLLMAEIQRLMGGECD